MKRLILGTAGHIDHGKTTLVKALTGVDTDRLPEEKARGITIDLGFALLKLGDLMVGIVDVPGHEGLVRNMLAGATGFDAMLLVVAADEGVMPQTREHVAIADLLGITRAVVAVTKADSVNAEWLELVTADIAEYLSGFSFGDAPIVAVSAVTGDGLRELRSAIAAQLNNVGQRIDQDLFRLPIDRAFTAHGTGTVVTGTVWSGTARRDELAHIMPGARATRIRAIQTHGAAVEQAGAGERAAFALVGVEKAQIVRGDVLTISPDWESVSVVTARVRMLGPALKARQRLRLHLGTAEVMARVVLLGADWAQLRLESPIVARAGDRFVIRSYSPMTTIGGGRVAEVGIVRRDLNPDAQARLQLILHGRPAQRLLAAVELAGAEGVRLAALPLRTGLPPTEIDQALAELAVDVVCTGPLCYSAATLDSAAHHLAEMLQLYHDKHPLRPGIERAELLNAVPSTVSEAAFRLAEQRGLLRRTGSLVARAGFSPSLTAAQLELQATLLTRISEGGLMPPTIAELEKALGSRDVRPVLRLLEADGRIKPVSQDLYLESATLAAAIEKVRSSVGPGPIAAADFRTALPVSRKYLIPLLEYLDRAGVTRREGDSRWLEGVERLQSG